MLKHNFVIHLIKVILFILMNISKLYVCCVLRIPKLKRFIILNLMLKIHHIKFSLFGQVYYW